MPACESKSNLSGLLLVETELSCPGTYTPTIIEVSSKVEHTSGEPVNGARIPVTGSDLGSDSHFEVDRMRHGAMGVEDVIRTYSRQLLKATRSKGAAMGQIWPVGSAKWLLLVLRR